MLRYGGHTSCVEIAPSNGARVIFDAGSGIRALGAYLMRQQAESVAGAEEVVHLFLTHQHFDHIIGLPHFQPLRSDHHRVVLRCGNATLKQLQALVQSVLAPPLFVSMPKLADTLRVESCGPEIPMPVGDGCVVHRLEARHTGGAAIFRVDDTAGPAIAFAPDNELSYASVDPEVIEWRTNLVQELQHIPVLVHDATYHNDELVRFAGWGHSSAEEATQLAIECKAGRLVLFHHHPDRTDSEIDDLVWNCRSLAHRAGSRLQIDAAYEGMMVAV